MISNCGHDENNRYRGGKAGDQTGTEWRVINWYNRPWKCVLRHPDAKVRKMIASMAKAAAVNNKIGYDQSERYTFWEHLKASNYDPAQITIACEADCSSGVAAIVKGAGYRLGNEKMKNSCCGRKEDGQNNRRPLPLRRIGACTIRAVIRAYRQKRGRHPETGVVLVL